jgi:hypothetical protein
MILSPRNSAITHATMDNVSKPILDPCSGEGRGTQHVSWSASTRALLFVSMMLRPDLGDELASSIEAFHSGHPGIIKTNPHARTTSWKNSRPDVA